MPAKVKLPAKSLTVDSVFDASIVKMMLEVANTFSATKTITDYKYGGTTTVDKHSNAVANDVKDRVGILKALKNQLQNPNATPETVQDILTSM